MFALVDGNNFYATCETVFRPALAGRPLVVLSNNDGCAVARSEAAKALGIKMGAPWFQIARLAESDGLIGLSANFPLYGFMDLKSLREYDALCLDDEMFEAKDIVKLRSQLQISQGVLAAFVNTTTSSVAQWEAGDKRPGGPARRVLGLLKRKGLEAFV